MKNPMQKLRRFFVRSRTYNTAAARTASHAAVDEDDGGHRLSGAFIVVLVLHIIAVAGVFAFARVKESRASGEPRKSTAPAATQKPAPAKSASAAAPTGASTRTSTASNDSQKSASGSQTMNVLRDGATPTKITAALSENRTATPPAQKPTPASERKTAKTYTVKKGDSPVKIAREHGCSYEELMKLNGIKDPKKIQTGQVLKLPAKNG